MCEFLELWYNLENKLFFVEDPVEEGFDEDPEGWVGESNEAEGKGATAEEEEADLWDPWPGPAGGFWSVKFLFSDEQSLGIIVSKPWL